MQQTGGYEHLSLADSDSDDVRDDANATVGATSHLLLSIEVLAAVHGELKRNILTVSDIL